MSNKWLLIVYFFSFGFNDIRIVAQDQKQPNILWITTEDISATLSSYGDHTVPTPNVDRLSRQGILFTNMYSAAGVCAPARSALITGMYTTYLGTNNMRTGSGHLVGLKSYEAVPPPEVKGFPEYLRANGYYCTNNFKTDYQIGDPFTIWDENSKEAHWRNRPYGKPFFSVFNIMATHESRIWGRSGKPLRVNPDEVPLPPYYPDTPLIRNDIARYYDNIMVMDSIVGVIMQQLEEDKLLDDTIVFFFSDHGGNLPWQKRELYDRGLHVPFIVRFPDGFKAGTVNEKMHSFVDLAPTILSLTGTDIPPHLQGQAFLGEKTNPNPRKYIFAARDRTDEEYDMVRAVRDPRFKYIRNFQPQKTNYQQIGYRLEMNLMKEILRLKEEGILNEVQQRWFEKKPAEELYDTHTDPYEINNLANESEFFEKRNELRLALMEWCIDTRDKGFLPEKELLEMMWPGGQQPLTMPPVIEQTYSGEDIRILTFSCPTEGASLGYKYLNTEEWQLYTKPLMVEKDSTIVAKAIRYGYLPSAEVEF